MVKKSTSVTAIFKPDASSFLLMSKTRDKPEDWPARFWDDAARPAMPSS